MSPEDREKFALKCRRDPSWYARKVLGVRLWWMQKDILASIRDNKRTAVKACHAPGKTFTAAVASLWFLSSFRDSIVITTAPTWRQVKDVLWREIRRLRENSRVEIGGRIKLDPPTLEFGAKWYAMGLSPKDEDSFAGWHAPYVLIICDEASGVPVKILEAIRGLMASGRVRLLYLGNPLRPEGGFYEAFNKSAKLWKPFTIGAFDTPNLMHLKADFDRCKTKQQKLHLLRSAKLKNRHLITAEWVADCLEEFGEDSDFWISRVMGEFPDGAPNQLIPLWQVMDARARYENELVLVNDKGDVTRDLRWWERSGWNQEIIGGFDIARKGSNESVFAARSIDIETGLDILAPLRHKTKMDTDEVVEFGEKSYRFFNCNKANGDNVGYGGGPMDTLEKIKDINFYGVNVGTPAKRSDIFLNLRAEAFFDIRRKFESGIACIPPDDKLSGQLSSIRYDSSGRKTKIESKETMEKRGVKSPDRADAYMLTEASVEQIDPGYSAPVEAPKTDVFTVERKRTWR